MKKPFIFISAFMLSLVLLVASVAEESIAIPTDKISEMTFSSMLSEDGQYQAAAVSLENLKQLYEEDVNELITELKEGSAAIAALGSTKTNLFMIYACTSRKCHMLVYSFEDDEYTYTTEENKGWNPKEDVVGVCGNYKQKEICDTYMILEPNILLGTLSQLSNVSSSSNAQSNESQNTQDDNIATEGYNRTITFESLEVSVEKGKKITLEPVVVRNNDSAPAETVCVFSSDNESIARVENGVVIGVSSGNCNIICQAEDDSTINTSVFLVVFEKIKSIKSDVQKLIIGAGDSYQVTITYAPESGILKELEWTSSDENIATVNEEGLITGLTKGDAVITAKTVDGTNKTIKINVHIPSFFIPSDSYEIDNSSGLLLPIVFSECTASDLIISMGKDVNCFSYSVTADNRIRITPVKKGNGKIKFKCGKDEKIIDITVNSSAIDVSKYQDAKYVQFGNYEQDLSIKGKEPIQWEIVEINGTLAVLMSRYILDCQPYDNKGGEAWESASLNQWVNSTFKNAAFSKEEQKALIADISIPGSSYSIENMKLDPSVKINSISDIESGLIIKGDWTLVKKLTSYAEQCAHRQGAHKSISGAFSYWTVGGGDVDKDGKSWRGIGGSGTKTKYIGVVPVIYVDLAACEAKIVK